MRIRRTVPIIAAISFLLLAVACARTPDHGHSFTVETIEGIPTAVTRGGPKYDRPLFTFEEIVTLKEDTTDTASLLYRPGMFVTGEDGRFYVADSGNHRIAVFDAAGNHVGSFGREGQGPGDIGDINWFSLSDGEIQVWEMHNERVSRFRTDGSLIRIVPVPRRYDEYRTGVPFRMHVLDDGRIVLITQQEQMLPDAIAMRRVAFLVTAGEDSLFSVRTPWLRTGRFIPYGSGLRMYTQPPFLPFPDIVFSRLHGLVINPGTGPILECVDLDNRVRRIMIDGEPPAVTAEDRAGIRRRLEEQLARSEGRQRDMIKAEMGALDLPLSRPWWRQIQVDDQGYFWLSCSETADEREAAGGSIRYRLLSPRGEYLGDVRLPLFVGGMSFYRGRLLGILPESVTATDRLRVYRIVPAVPGLRYP
jgi:hypothetical protein